MGKPGLVIASLEILSPSSVQPPTANAYVNGDSTNSGITAIQFYRISDRAYRTIIRTKENIK